MINNMFFSVNIKHQSLAHLCLIDALNVRGREVCHELVVVLPEHLLRDGVLVEMVDWVGARQQLVHFLPHPVTLSLLLGGALIDIEYPRDDELDEVEIITHQCPKFVLPRGVGLTELKA